MMVAVWGTNSCPTIKLWPSNNAGMLGMSCILLWRIFSLALWDSLWSKQDPCVHSFFFICWYSSNQVWGLCKLFTFRMRYRPAISPCSVPSDLLIEMCRDYTGSPQSYRISKYLLKSIAKPIQKTIISVLEFFYLQYDYIKNCSFWFKHRYRVDDRLITTVLL